MYPPFRLFPKRARAQRFIYDLPSPLGRKKFTERLATVQRQRSDCAVTDKATGDRVYFDVDPCGESSHVPRSSLSIDHGPPGNDDDDQPTGPRRHGLRQPLRERVPVRPGLAVGGRGRLDDRRRTRGAGGPRRRGHQRLRPGRRDIRGRAADRVAQGVGRRRRPQEPGVPGMLRRARPPGVHRPIVCRRVSATGVRRPVLQRSRARRRVPLRAATASENRRATVVGRHLQRGPGPQGFGGERGPAQILLGRAAKEIDGQARVRGGCCAIDSHVRGCTHTSYRAIFQTVFTPFFRPYERLNSFFFVRLPRFPYVFLSCTTP